MKRFLAVALMAIALTGCTNDVIIRGNSGVVNVGEVTAEQAVVKVTGQVEQKQYTLGTYPVGEFASTISAGWTDVDGTAMLEKDIRLKLETTVTYIGTKNTVEVLVDTTNVVCPKGFMFITCMSQIQSTQDGLVQMYKQKFSYMK